MHLRATIVAVAMTSIGWAAFAQDNASGILQERKEAMKELGGAMRAIAPMMRGEAEYDAAVVREAADTMIGNSGSNLTDLFPEGSNEEPSEALDKVWEDWDEFAALADMLGVYAEGMKLAADNGLAAAGETATEGMMGADDSMMGEGHDEVMTAEMLGEMPVNAAFMMVAQTCSTCHQGFRAEDE